MTLSKEERVENVALALSLMLLNLSPARPYAWEEFDGDIEPFNLILTTTWSVLCSKGLVKPNGMGRYQLTSSGWIEALKITGRFDSTDAQQQAGKLAAGLKRHIDGRTQDGRVDRTELAQETGLEEAFVYDAVDSHLLQHLFGIMDAQWAPDDRMNNWIEIPVDFGHKLR
jgi:hypothetical protein